MDDLLRTRVGLDDITAAAEVLSGRVLRTPTVPSPGLTAHLGVPVSLKLELLQPTGSFKVRGVTAKLLALTRAQCAAGVAAVSGGNHGLAVAHVAGSLGIPAVVVMPQAAPARSVAAARAAGAEVRLTEDMPTAFALLDDLVAAGRTLVHPFDDPVVIAAQGTVGLELAADASEVTDVLVSVGGGGLASGVAAALRALAPDVRVWGVETKGADAMRRALDSGAPVAFTPTSIASTLSAPFVSELTLGHVRELLQDVLVVSDADAVGGTLTLAEEAKLWAEPSAGCLVPAAHRVLDRVGPEARLAMVVCGGNVTVADVMGWAERFSAGPLEPRRDALRPR